MTFQPSSFLMTVLSSARRIPALLVDSHTAVWAGTLAVASWAIGAPNLRLLRLVLVAMLLDLATGAAVAALRSLRAKIDPSFLLAPGEGWDARKLYGGIIGKVVRLLAIPAASCADWLFLVAPFGGHPAATAYSYPISAYVLWALAIAEVVSVMGTLASAGVATEALRALIPRLQASQPKVETPTQAATIIRDLDRGVMGEEPPDRRAYDAIAIEAERAKAACPPPAPELPHA